MITRSGLAENAESDDRAGAWRPEVLQARRLGFGDAALARIDCSESLRRTIEAEIIPRLMLAHRLPSNDARAPLDPRPEIAPDEVELLTDLVLQRDSAAAQAYVRARRGAGVPVETLYLDLLSPVARRLGELWDADLCDFTQVTVGLWRLQQLVYEYSDLFQRDRRMGTGGRRALLASAPGSQHTFGVVMVGEFFRRAGWDVRGDPGAVVTEVKALVAAESFDVLGLSVGTECQVGAISSAILRFRKASRNPALVVMVGGPAVASAPDFSKRVGADGAAADAASAVLEAASLVARKLGTT